MQFLRLKTRLFSGFFMILISSSVYGQSINWQAGNCAPRARDPDERIAISVSSEAQCAALCLQWSCTATACCCHYNNISKKCFFRNAPGIELGTGPSGEWRVAALSGWQEGNCAPWAGDPGERIGTEIGSEELCEVLCRQRSCTGSSCCCHYNPLSKKCFFRDAPTLDPHPGPEETWRVRALPSRKWRPGNCSPWAADPAELIELHVEKEEQCESKCRQKDCKSGACCCHYNKIFKKCYFRDPVIDPDSGPNGEWRALMVP